MSAIWNVIAPHAKALILIAAIVVAIVADNNGVDLGLNIETLWSQLAAVGIPAALVWLVPNSARRGTDV